MRVGVLNSQIPGTRGGAEILAEQLVASLREIGHDAVHLTLPFGGWTPTQVLKQIEASRRWHFDDVDRLIALKFPVYLVPHHDKVVWLLHQHRPAYDLWGGGMGIPGRDAGRARGAIHAADRSALSEANRLFAISDVVSRRLQSATGLTATVLHPPLVAAEQYRSESYGDYVFCPVRLAANKRPELLIEAMRHVRSDIRLVLAGVPPSDRQLIYLRTLVFRYRLRRRVSIMPQWISENLKVDLYSRARAVAYVPIDEDYGFVPLEAAASRRPIVTCTDSGGAQLLVEDGVSGRIVPPDPQALAEAFDGLLLVPGLAASLGDGARAKLDGMGSSWPSVAHTLAC